MKFASCILVLVLCTCQALQAQHTNGNDQHLTYNKPLSKTNRKANTAARALRLAPEASINLDGQLDDPAWQNSTVVTGFLQRDPVEGASPSEKTVVHIRYDDAAIYVGARMYDTHPDSIMAQLGRRDVDLTADQFVFYVDPYNDDQTGFYFGINAAGTLYDGTLYNDGWSSNSWDGVWEGKAHIDDKGWTAELRIPYSQLRFQKKQEYVWGVNFKRVIARNNERDYKVYQPKNGSGFVSRFIDLRGINQINPPRHFEVIPYVTSKAAYLNVDPANPFNDGSKYSANVGGDIRTSIGSNLTVNATINPDFGQVEVDPAVVNLSDVETFFPEKRPFFIEGRSYFNFGRGGAQSMVNFNWSNPQFFYSRRIGRAPQGSLPDADFTDRPEGTTIIGAAKVTGRLDGGWNVGSMHAVTAGEDGRYALNGHSRSMQVEPPTYYGVTRIQKEFNGARQSLGMIATYTKRSFGNQQLRDELNDNSLVLGLDGWTFLDREKAWVLTGWTSMSKVSGTQARITDVQQFSQHYMQRPDRKHYRLDSTATSLTGFAGRTTLSKQKGNLFFNAAFGFVDPRYDINDIGFMWRGDMINMHAFANYSFTDPTSWYRSMSFGAALFQSFDFDGNSIWNGVFQNGSFEFLNYHSINWNLAYNPESISSRLTRGGPLSKNYAGYQVGLNYHSDSRKDVVFGLGYFTYRTTDDSYSDSYDMSIQWKPASNLSMEITPGMSRNYDNVQYVTSVDDPMASATYGSRYVFATIDQKTFSAGVRVNWTFTPQLSLQMYAQPLVSSGDYSRFKELERPRTHDYLVYGTGGSTYDASTGTADPDGAGPAQSFVIDNPDFNFKSLRGNAVLRWEFQPGSTLYFVWTQTRSDSQEIGQFDFGHSMHRLINAKPDNIFLVKFSYWFNI